MEIINRISSPMSESWVAWVLLLLLICWVVKGMFLLEISTLFRGLFSRCDRSYTTNNGLLQYITLIYKLGIITLLIYAFFFQKGDFAFIDYSIVLGILALVHLLQWVLIRIVGLVFLSHRQLEIATEQRNIINDAICGILPLMMVLLYQIRTLNIILVSLLICLYFGIIFMKSMQLFFKNILSVFYVLLYIISLEFIPLAFAILWIKNIVQ
jgi:hypothetical protein